MSTLTLIGSHTSPYVRKVRILLAEKCMDYEFIVDDVWRVQPQVLAFNPLGQVPCLVLATGQVLTDSRSIAEYLDWLTPSSEVRSIEHRFNILKWQALAEGIIDTSVKYRIEQMRPQTLQWHEWSERQKTKLVRCLTTIDGHLADQSWLANGQYSVADLTLQCALNFIDFRINDWDWRARFGHLKQFEAQLAQYPVYIDTLPKT